jgi:flagellar hook-length control protein FliK
LPHQQNLGTPNSDSTGSAGGSATAQGGSPQQPAAAGPNGNGTGSGAANNGQNGSGATLPPTAAQLNARVIAGAQALVSQPNSNLAALAHTAQATPGTAASAAETSTTPTPANPAQHGATAPDPGALLKSETGGAPGSPTPGMATAEQDAAQATVQSAATNATRSATTDSADQTGDPGTQQPDPSSVATPLALQPAALLASAPTAQAATASTLAASTLDQIAFNLQQSLRTGLNQIEIQLKPASLGSIDVKLEMTHDGRMTAVISSDRSDTLNLLQRNSGELQQALRDAGLQTDNGSLSFNLRGEQQQPGNQGQQGSYLAGNSTSADPGTGETQPLPIAAAAAGASSSHAGLLNIQV